jgi:hypothetical protein
MSIPSQILMNLLSSGVRAISGATPAAGAATGSADFAAMLGRAKAGELTTGLPVTIARGAEVELSDEQLGQLAVAADRAESAGSRRALALLDGRAIEIDVATRQVIREHSLENARVVTGIDGVIDLDGSLARADADAGDAAAAAHAASARLDQSRWNRSLVEALAQR